ncbi:MAG TPA: radical SAM protein [Candidatus Dormibacteraeota bacterium]|nr:radical SAM protein [Candidatus Dormibacteraeota bacterium]
MSELALAYADPEGRLIEESELGALARSGHEVGGRGDGPAFECGWMPLPDGATVTNLPGRLALGREPSGETVRLSPDAGWAVAAVLPPGFTRTLLPAFEEDDEQPVEVLPVFGYAALAFRGGRPVVAATRTDALDWWQPRQFAGHDIQAAINQAGTDMPANRLVAHLARCATDYNCYTAQNTFYRRWEGALPTSGPCNAMCVGCISEQWGEVESPQDRIGFRPTVDEVVELATWHLGGDDAQIVSFGQGCEGEPLMRPDLPEMVARIKAARPRAFVNINTNGSRPEVIEGMIEAGLDGARVSVFSFNDDLFRAYYRPKDYGLDQVHGTLAALRASGKRVTLNLLTFPGVTDDAVEVEALEAAIARHRIDQVQTRSLNIDPLWLLRRLPRRTTGTGMEALIRRLSAAATVGNFTLPATAGR